VAAAPEPTLNRTQNGVRTLEMCVSASVTGLAGGRSQKWTLSGADPSGCALRRFRYMCSVKNGVNGDMTYTWQDEGSRSGSPALAALWVRIRVRLVTSSRCARRDDLCHTERASRLESLLRQALHT